jgi:hypothetical protein
MKKYSFDANCFIDAVNQNSPRRDALQQILQAARSGAISLSVSLHTLNELGGREDEALRLAKTLPVLSHWPIGSWNDQVGTWYQATGSWDDGRRNDEAQTILKARAKSGNSIRDRGAYIDALRNDLDGFITSDKQLIAPGPANRINNEFSTKVLTPESLASSLSLERTPQDDASP